jgi:hypothetical protein
MSSPHFLHGEHGHRRGDGPYVAAAFTGQTEDYRVFLRVKDERGRPVPVVSKQTMHVLAEAVCFWHLRLPPASKCLSLTFIVHRGRTVEFVVKPPPPEEAKRQKERRNVAADAAPTHDEDP